VASCETKNVGWYTHTTPQRFGTHGKTPWRRVKQKT